MNNDSRIQEESVAFNVPWNPFTARGFAIACGVVALLIILISFVDVTPIPYKLPENVIPDSSITLIFGSGDGTGGKHGNLKEEGTKKRGKTAPDPLDDAVSATKSSLIKKDAQASDPTQTTKLIPKKDIASSTKDTSSNSGSTKSIGDPVTGSPDGTGLGRTGVGTGKGEGWGDIDWGGGGNRTVVYKKKPPFPDGAQPAEIRIRFRVRPDGTVSTMIPLQKADPRLERAAMEALRMWKFNPIQGNNEMTGVIPFQFKLN